MISSSDHTLYFDRWLAAEMFLWCEPAEMHFENLINDYPKNFQNNHISNMTTVHGPARHIVRRAFDDDWIGFCVANESNYEFLAFRNFFTKITERNNGFYHHLSTECVAVPIPNTRTDTDHYCLARFIMFEFPEDAKAFLNMTKALPPRIWVSLAGINIRPEAEFKKLTSQLNIKSEKLSDGDQRITFADTPFAEQIKMLAALSRGVD